MPVRLRPVRNDRLGGWVRACGLVVVAVLLAALLGGCGGVILNAEYSQLLDETAALSAETAARAGRGNLDANEMVESLRLQAGIWQRFRDARDGVASGGPAADHLPKGAGR